MKQKILNYIYSKYYTYFEKRFLKELTEKRKKEMDKVDMEELFEKNKYFFELLLIKDFVGYIPKSVNEPALKIFQDYGENFEKWILWQSWYINRKAMNEPMKIPFYNGMMVYLKVLYTMASVNKKEKEPVVKKTQDEKVEVPWIEEALQGIKDFNIKRIQTDENNKTTETESA